MLAKKKGKTLRAAAQSLALSNAELAKRKNRLSRFDAGDDAASAAEQRWTVVSADVDQDWFEFL